jgi:hypothetical protein
MRKIFFSVATLVVVAVGASAQVPDAEPAEKMYESHIHPDGKLHCFGTGKTCSSW